MARTDWDVAGAVAAQGWVRLRNATTPDDRAVLSDCGTHEWRPLAEAVGYVRMQGWYCQPPVEELPTAVRDFSVRLASDLGLAEEFNEISWQRHTRGAIAVSPHKDQAYYTGYIAVATLTGRAQFSILASRRLEDVVASWTAEPGDLVVLAGDGACPWHMVDAPLEGERTTLTFRRTTGIPGGWE